MSVLTAEARQVIRTARAEHARMLFAEDAATYNRCNECQGELDGWTLGCGTCGNRHNRKAREGRHPHPQWFRARAELVAAHGAMLRRYRQTEILRERRQRGTSGTTRVR